MERFAERLKVAMENRNLKPSELAELANLPKSSISQYLSGMYEAKSKGIYKLAQALNVSEAWLMGLDVPMSNDIALLSNAIEVVKIPVLGKVSAGVPIMAEENFEGYALAPASQIKSDKEYFYLRVQGDSMNLKFPEGCIVLIEKTDYIEDGDIGVIAINGYDATIKLYKRKGNTISLNPMSSNPIHQQQMYDIKETTIHVLGKAISYQGTI